MLDFTLHGWDVVDALGLEPPHLVGHSMGGMIAAEMACLRPRASPSWRSSRRPASGSTSSPIPDIFAMLPYELAEVLFHDPAPGAALLTGGADFSDMERSRRSSSATPRRLGTAGKILFPIPNRRLSKRLYRLTAPTLVVWGAHDRLILPAYAARWKAMIPSAREVTVENAGHMLPYEQPEAFVRALGDFLG